eukprot:GHRR01036912.1.p1 GENE.GHRR01036912.1~~GHRR01036912.1.p1  ORF type:complete len:304 (+),score=63.47 GHRR01036912.1:331-1242(+)
MNATQPPSKRSRIERSVDRIIFFMFGLLFSMCLTGCIYFAWWTANYMPQHWYLAPNEAPREYDSAQPGIVAVTNFITAFILYGYLIPIALYVSMEMVKIVQSLCFIGLDRSMYHAETDTPAVARTSNLNEELGMVNTILSDKTGTLTRNVMEYFKCSIAGEAYGAGITEIERNNAERRGLKLDVPDEEADNKYREQYFNFYDDRLMGLEWAKQPHPDVICQFFRLLALCNTAIPDGGCRRTVPFCSRVHRIPGLTNGLHVALPGSSTLSMCLAHCQLLVCILYSVYSFIGRVFNLHLNMQCAT